MHTSISPNARADHFSKHVLNERRKSVIERAFRALNEAHVKYGIVNGAFDYPAKVGRDIDVLVASNDIDSATQLIVLAFKEAGMEVKTFVTPYAVVQIHAYCLSDECIWGAEIDLITEYLWAGCLLRAEISADSVGLVRGELIIDPWGNFAKAVLIQLLCGDLEKAKKNASAGNSLWSDRRAGKAILDQLQSIYPPKIAEELLQTVIDGNEEKLVAMRRDLRWQTIIGCFRRYGLIESLRNCSRWGLRTIKRKMVTWNPMPILAISGKNEVMISSIIAQLAKGISARYVFVAVTPRVWHAELAAANIEEEPKEGHRLPTSPVGLLRSVLALCKLTRLVMTSARKDREDSRAFRLPVSNQFWGNIANHHLRYGIPKWIPLQGLVRILPTPDCIVLLSDAETGHQEHWAEFRDLFPKTIVLNNSLSEAAIIDHLEHIIICSFLGIENHLNDQ